MEERNIKCSRCNKSITRLEEMGKWRGNSVLVDDHTYDIDTFCCECRECSDSENRKSKLKRCQGAFSVHYDEGLGYGGSTQFNQCDLSVPIGEGDFCQHCKGQTETYQQLRARIKAEEKQIFENFCQAQKKAQNY
ncbi:13441_t:CDS:1 [Entrophospora sp. SA101]|nr:13441_t:CDS:1 [Entrophospora sp. SA101]